MDSWIAQMCAATSRRQFLAWFFVLCAGLVFVVSNARYIRNFVGGPFPFQADDLMRVTDADSAPHYFVSVNSNRVLDTGIQEITSTTEDGNKTGESVSAGYYAFVIGDRALIVKSAHQPPNSVAGELMPFPSDLASQLFSGPDAEKLRARAYPFYLDTDGFRTPGYWAIAIGIAFLALFVWFGGRAWTRWRDVAKHPVLKRVTEQWGDVLGVSVEAERELTGGVAYRSNGVNLTNSFVIQKTFFVFNIFRFKDLLWAYKKVTKRRVYFVPVGKTYQAMLVCYGGSQQFSAPKKKVDEVLQFASGKAPWALRGYSKDAAETFRKRNAEFCQAIEAKRKALANNPV